MKRIGYLLVLICLVAHAMPNHGTNQSADISWQYIGVKPDRFNIYVWQHQGSTNTYSVSGSFHGTTVSGFYSGFTYTVTVSALWRGMEYGWSSATVTVPYSSPQALSLYQ